MVSTLELSSQANSTSIYRQSAQSQIAQLTSSNNNLSTILNNTSATGNRSYLVGNAASLYGVGLCYQLYEMQQIYRHPRKIYELAINLTSSQTVMIFLKEFISLFLETIF